MTFDEYDKSVLHKGARLPYFDALAMGGLGITGEAGEVSDILKKHLYHGKLLDYTHLIEELGDVLWYVAYLAHKSGYSLESVARANMEKLDKRYPEGFKV